MGKMYLGKKIKGLYVYFTFAVTDGED